MHLTPGILEAAYEYLRATPPFNRWKLPDPDTLVFRVMKTRHPAECALWDDGRWSIDVSTEGQSHTATLLEAVAHEMCHLHQGLRKMPLRHNAEFRRMVKQVCREHGFDPKRL